MNKTHRARFPKASPLRSLSAGLPCKPVLDMHCHAAGIGAGGSGCFISPTMARSFKFGCYLKSFGVTRAELEGEGDAVVIARLSQQLSESRHADRAVVLALDGAAGSDGQLDHENTEAYVPNEYLAAEVAKYPNLLFGASVNPYRSDALERLTWAKKHGAVLIKWLPAIQQIDAADRRCVPFYEKLIELRLPLLSHTGPEHSFTRANDAFSDPERLRLPASLGVTVIAAHVAAGRGSYQGERPIDRLAHLMTLYPNAYADVSALTLMSKLPYVREVVTRPEFRGRLLYGSDHPLTAMPALVSPWYNVFRLPPTKLHRIAQLRNPWDRDIALKCALGFPDDVWTRAEEVLNLSEASSPGCS